MARGNRTSKGGHPKPRVKKVRMAVNVLPETLLFIQMIALHQGVYQGDLIHEWCVQDLRKIYRSRKEVKTTKSFRNTVRLFLEKDLEADRIILSELLGDCSYVFGAKRPWPVKVKFLFGKIGERIPIDITWIKLPRTIKAPKLPRIKITLAW